ncbi:MAG TPA: CYTH and CHAD domain-containing protein [Actinomycetota bacterium]
MSEEREVKLAAPATFKMPSFDGLGEEIFVEAPTLDRYQTVYLDTPDFRLARWGVSLRHRSGQGWTVKLPPVVQGDLIVRGEHTFDGDDPGDVPPDALDPIRAYVRTADLKPVVRLRTVRRSIRARDLEDRQLVEITDDEVSVLAGRRIAARFRELEVEVGDITPPGLLEEVLGRLRAAGAGDPDPTPKYVRAVGPLGTQAPEIVTPPLASGATAGDVVRRSIAASVTHLIRHDVVMRLDADPEGVHQARVSTRRLRSDLRTFRSLLDPEWTRALREELRWLGGVLGRTRDSDVLLERMRSRIDMIPATERPGAAQIVEVLEQSRKATHAELLETLREERYVELLDRLVTAANEPALLLAADLPAAQVLPGLVRGPWKALRREVRAVGSRPTDPQLHRVRILTKRVRYAADVVEPLLGRPARRFAMAAADLQTVLGEHNDAVVAEAWLRGWAAEARSGDATFAAGMLAGIERASADLARRTWRRTWRKLAGVDRKAWM